MTSTNEPPLPPEWLCIDRYRDKASRARRLREKYGDSGGRGIHMEGSKGPVEGIPFDWDDPDVRDYVLESVPEQGFDEIARVLGVSESTLRQAYEDYGD